jgi:hypothetical protein
MIGTLHEHQYTFMIIYCPVLRMRNVSDETCRENQNTYYIQYPPQSCHLCDNVEKCCRAGQATDDNIIWYIHIVCLLRLQTHTQNM